MSFFRRKRPIAPGFASLSTQELKSKGWTSGLSAETRAKLLGLSLADSFADLPDTNERERQNVRLAKNTDEAA